MRAVLGIDAAWTEGQPSGVALIQGEGDRWRVVCAAPSYEAFLTANCGTPVDWNARRFNWAKPSITELIGAARAMATSTLCVVAVDMPLANTAIISRRVADSEISKIFGDRGCSTHSPSAVRPGQLGESLMAQLLAQGFPLATTDLVDLSVPCTIEVYPHPALLALLGSEYRIPYKVSRSLKYWPDTSVPERIALILDEFERINAALGLALGGPPLVLPFASGVHALSGLKSYEDVLDALVCAWVGLQFLQHCATAYGDSSAAIWVPSAA